jgi:hypothetical protein
MMRRIETLAIAIAVFGALPSHAQQQTPESANLFLQTALKDVPLKGSTGLDARYSEFKPGTANGCVLNGRMVQPNGIGMWVEHDFSMTLEVRVIGDWVRETRKIQGSARDFTFEVGSKAMAERVAGAIEFLRKRCDKAAGTGF